MVTVLQRNGWGLKQQALDCQSYALTNCMSMPHNCVFVSEWMRPSLINQMCKSLVDPASWEYELMGADKW